MFQLTADEAAGLRFHFETSKRGRGGRRYLPYAFTEQERRDASSPFQMRNVSRQKLKRPATFWNEEPACA